MKETMESMVKNLSSNVPKPAKTYLGNDGILHCSNCNKPVETIVEFLGMRRKVGCICDCKVQELEAIKQRELKEQIERKRKICFAETNMASWRFENDDRHNEKLSNMMIRYTEQFKDFKKQGQGILLYGTPGTGKTFYAACIANRLIDKGYDVLMSNFVRLSNQIQSTFEGKNEIVDSLNRYQLLIIDDLGIERNTEYMVEQIYNIVDSRYRSGLPMIVTTNLPIQQIKEPEKLNYLRICDRILERCFPIEVNGKSRRRQVARERFFNTKERLEAW